MKIREVRMKNENKRSDDEEWKEGKEGYRIKRNKGKDEERKEGK